MSFDKCGTREATMRGLEITIVVDKLKEQQRKKSEKLKMGWVA